MQTRNILLAALLTALAACQTEHQPRNHPGIRDGRTRGIQGEAAAVRLR